MPDLLARMLHSVDDMSLCCVSRKEYGYCQLAFSNSLALRLYLSQAHKVCIKSLVVSCRSCGQEILAKSRVYVRAGPWLRVRIVSTVLSAIGLSVLWAVGRSNRGVSRSTVTLRVVFKGLLGDHAKVGS